MLDLIGFWTAVTLIVSSILFAPIFLAAANIGFLIEAASRNRVLWYKWGYGKWWMSLGYAEKDAYGLMLALGCCISAAFTVVTLVQETPLLETVSMWSMTIVPITTWVGIIGVGVFGSFFAMRKGFDIFFSVKDKLAKLEK